MNENSICVVIVNPKSDRIYNYWINGSEEKRSMLKERMREFCLDLCPIKARQINKCIDELIPFVIFVEEKTVQELEEKSKKEKSKMDRLFPMRKSIYNKTAVNKKEVSDVEKLGKQFNIWEKYNIQLNNRKNKTESLFKGRIL